MSQDDEVGKGGRATGPDDSAVLFPDVTVCGLTVKPWTMNTMNELSPSLLGIFRGLKKEGIKISEAMDNFVELILITVPYMARIISLSSGCTEEYAGKLEPGDAVNIMTVIVTQNWKRIKNSLGLGQNQFKVG